MGKCKVVEKFWCVYLIAAHVDGEPGFHVGNVLVSCEHCLERTMASFGGTVIYKKRFKTLPPWEWIEPRLKKAGDDWLEAQELSHVVN